MNFHARCSDTRMSYGLQKSFFTGRNLLTFTKFRGIDPEVNRNVSYGVNPNTKQMSIGVEIGL